MEEKYIEEIIADSRVAFIQGQYEESLKLAKQALAQDNSNGPSELIMRDISELKRVYPDIPESSINELINMFKGMGYKL